MRENESSNSPAVRMQTNVVPHEQREETLVFIRSYSLSLLADLVLNVGAETITGSKTKDILIVK